MDGSKNSKRASNASASDALDSQKKQKTKLEIVDFVTSELQGVISARAIGAVPIDETLFSVKPSNVVIEKYEAYGSYKVEITLFNRDKVRYIVNHCSDVG